MHWVTADIAPANPPTSLPHKRSGNELATAETTDPSTNKLAEQQMVHLRPQLSTTIPETKNKKFTNLNRETGANMSTPLQHTYFLDTFFAILLPSMCQNKVKRITGPKTMNVTGGTKKYK
jgi:hypothetical protein